MSETARVVLDLSAAVQRRAGVGRYAASLARALVGLADAPDLRLFYADARGRTPPPPLHPLPRHALRWPSKLWRASVMLASAARLPMDALVGPGNVFHATDHLLPPLRGLRSVFTLHDVAFLTSPETHLRSNRWFLQLMMPAFLRRADAVICISEHTRSDALRLYRLDPSKLHVIPLGVEPRFHPAEHQTTLAALRTRLGLPERFILTVGTIEPRKNYSTLLRAFERLRATTNLDHHLVVVGRRGWLAEPFFSALARSPVRDAVHLVGQAPDEDLPAIYRLADLFVYPSLYEGFGLPPLEAMACGVPAVVSNTSSLPEVVGDAALLVDPADDQELSEAMCRALRDPALRGALRARGLARARMFTWEEAAQRTLEVYRLCAALTAGPSTAKPKYGHL